MHIQKISSTRKQINLSFSILIFALPLLLPTTEVLPQIEVGIDHILKDVQVMNICRNGDELWLATNGSGIYRYSYSTGSFTNYSTSNQKLQNDFIYSIAVNDNYVWAGSIDGLFIFDKQKNSWSKRKFSAGGQLGNWIRAISYDPYEDVVWIGRFQFLTKYNIQNRAFTDFDLTKNKKEKTNNIKFICLDGDSLVWFGTEAGLHKYDKSKSLDDNTAITFFDNKLNNFYGESDEVSISAVIFEQGNMWIGLDEFITSENPDYNLGGIFKFDLKNSWQKFSTATNLPGNGVYAMECTGKYIWAAIYEFNKIDKEANGRGLALINRMNSEVKIINDTRMPSTVFDLYFDKDYIWLGSSVGLFRIYLRNDLVPKF
ncbi:MAG: hypothetical protein V1720_10340 [bacterium]